MVVRFDVDAYLPESGKVSTIPSDPVDAQLEKLLHGLSITPAPQATPEASIPSVCEVRGGAYIPQNCIMELMARNQKNASFQWSETYPQLFFSQTPHFYLAVQTGGNFTALKRKNLQDQDVRNVGSGHQGDFRKLLIALEGIQKAMIESGQEGRCTLVHEGGELKVFNRLAQDSCLPQEVLTRFK
ncbi:hypothetical protein NLI96_g4016 [Meripilus lineatus]|uniref:Uncharacterized protein n=1 Tax=Meripilus lineatus TaxID=2056292 RepID=A0AAD5V7U6_9APHY|nr:hypothetical protein NLI96_g4016 [Physisporinus lineatus]